MKRPFQVAMLGWLFIIVGILSTAYHLWKGTLDRWMVLAWLAFYVGVGALDSMSAALPHVALLSVVGYVLLGALSGKAIPSFKKPDYLASANEHPGG
jgi:uncharacterized membrane protein HdeD (DUF308 family)